MRFDLNNIGPDVEQFLTDRHLATLTTQDRNGDPQVTPVGVTYDTQSGLMRVITWAAAIKAKNVVADPGQRVAICQVDGGRWLSAYGSATVTNDPDAVAEAVTRYAARYRQPKQRDDRVVIKIHVDSMVGRV